MSHELDIEDIQLNPRILSQLQQRWGAHSINRFASMLNTQLPHFNAGWRDYCDPPSTALPTVATKLRILGAIA
jgi:hypothetical protein